MSIEMMTAVWKQSRHKGGKLILLLAIADYANDQGVAWPSIESLAEKTRMSERNVHYTLKELIDEADPELSVDANAGPYRTNLYRLNLQGAKSSGCKTTQKRVQNPAKRVQPTAPNPSLEPSIEPSYIAADAAPPQKPVSPSKKKLTSRQTVIQTEPVMVPPAPPVTPEQAAADLAAWDALESASGRELPPPTGTSKDAIERALILACVPSGERREINALMGQIRKAGLIIREGDICTADDIMARCVGKGSLFYTTHFAENDEDGLTKPPTPMTIATWIWKLEECRSRKFKPVRAPIDYDQALAEAEARAARSREQSDPSPFKPIIPAWQVLTMPRRTA